MPAPRIAIYTAGPDADEHRSQLEALAVSYAWRLAGTYIDILASRPEFKRLQAAVMERKADLVMLHALGDLGNAVADATAWADWIESHGATVCCLQPAMGRASMDVIRDLMGAQTDRRSESKTAHARTPGHQRDIMTWVTDIPGGTALPLPRLQLTWEPINPPEAGHPWRCRYELVMPMERYDIRNPDNRGYAAAELGGTLATGHPLKSDGSVRIPFRDGAHVRHDAGVLRLPAYAVWDDHQTIISPAPDGK
jgi:Resolvase, N terminal domain